MVERWSKDGVGLSRDGYGGRSSLGWAVMMVVSGNRARGDKVRGGHTREGLVMVEWREGFGGVERRVWWWWRIEKDGAAHGIRE